MHPLPKPLPVLVVEDDPAIARALTRALRSRSVDVALVHNVGDAMARTDQFPVAIVDVHLPDGSGLDLFRRLHEQGRVKKSVFFTATESEDERLDAKACGTLVSKSEGVDRAVAEALELARSEQSGPELP